jgi:hypothetical protein
MEAPAAALLGALVGALAPLAVTVIGYFGQSRRERRQERVRLLQARAADLARVAQALATLQVWMEWVIWRGEHQRDNLADDEFHSSAEKVMEQLPELLAAVVVIGSWNAALYEQFLAFYHRALQLDEHINANVEGNGPGWPQLREQATQLFQGWAAAIQQGLHHL